jgi:hypothetical protein
MIFDLKPDEVSAYAAVATLVIAIFALFVAGRQLIIGKSEARRGFAYSIYKDYLALAFANPKFSSASYPIENPRMKAFSNDRDEYERYEYYVSYLLFAAEEVLNLSKNSASWRETLRDQLRYHALYLDSLDLPEMHYSNELLELREDAINAYKNQISDFRSN